MYCQNLITLLIFSSCCIFFFSSVFIEEYAFIQYLCHVCLFLVTGGIFYKAVIDFNGNKNI